jgi:uncharacterized membrane protein
MTRAVAALALIAACLGIGLRVAWLGHATFFADETVTAQRLAGVADRDIDALYDGRLHSAASLRALFATPAGATAVTQSLARDEPQHPPAFYLIERGAVATFGTSAGAYRALPALFGIIAIGLAFLVARRAFANGLAGAAAVTLVAASPFFVAYARQAREFALFVDAVLLAALALLWALERPRAVLRWGALCAASILGLYVSPLFVLVLVAFALTAAFAQIDRVRAWFGFVAAAAVALAAFAPWAVGTLRNGTGVDARLAWALVPYPLRLMAMKWGFAAGALAFDLEYAHPLLTVVAACVAVLAIAALVCLALRARAPEWRAGAALCLPLAIVPFAYLLVRDLAQHAHFSTIPRYLSASIVALTLALAGVLGGYLRSPARPVRAAAFAVTLALLVAGFVSSGAQVRAVSWWPNREDIDAQEAARAIGAAHAPIVVLQHPSPEPFELARYVHDDVDFLLLAAGARLAPPRGRVLFVVAPDAALLAQVAALTKAGYALRDVTPASGGIVASFRRGVGRDAGASLLRLDPPAAATSGATSLRNARPIASQSKVPTRMNAASRMRSHAAGARSRSSMAWANAAGSRATRASRPS